MNNFPGKRNDYGQPQHQTHQPTQFRKHYRRRGILASPAVSTTIFLVLFVIIVVLQSIFGK